MKYSVEVDGDAIAEIRDAVEFIAHERQAPGNASAWLNRLWDVIDSLEDLPRACPIDDRQSAATGHPTHKMNFGDYLIFYQVHDDIRQVQVIGFVHGARDRGELK